MVLEVPRMSLRQRPRADTAPVDPETPGSSGKMRSSRSWRSRNSKTPSGSERKGSKRNLASYLHLEFVGKKLGDTLHSSVDRAKGRRAAKKAQAKRRVEREGRR